ncbi:MAG TPA: zinc ribbon domain-containing protein [Methanomassiliicoccales archaeon]
MTVPEVCAWNLMVIGTYLRSGESMQKCWNCGADVPEQATYCPKCGKTFVATSPGSPQQPGPGGQPSQCPPPPYPYIPNYPYPPMQGGQLERKVDGLRNLVTAVLFLQIFFIILIFL